MPVTFLTNADHERLTRCPDELPQMDLDTCFGLTPDDFTVLSTLRGDTNRLGFALQLCCLRYLGFFPANLHSLDATIVVYVAEQLAVNPAAMTGYANREPTLYDHQQQVLSHAGYRRATPIDLLALDAWLLERALEHDRPKHIFDLACDYLRRERVVRPGVSVVARMVSGARDRATTITFERLSTFMSPERREALDGLLDTGGANVSRLAWLQRTPKSNRTSAILETLDKIAFLQALGVSVWNLEAVNPNRRKWLARKAAKAKVGNLRALSAEARYPQLAAFAQEGLLTFTDALLDMFDARLWELHGKCRLEFRNDRLAATKTINETMAVLQKLGKLYLNGDEVSTAPTEEEVRQALLSAEHLTRPEDEAYTDYFAKKHRQVQNFSKRLLEVMSFRRNADDAGLLEGLRLVSEIHASIRRKLPTSAPTAFVPPVWADEVFVDEGLNWRSFEIAALWVLRERLRSGDVFVANSRRYLQLERYLIEKTAWPVQRRDVPNLVGAPFDAGTRLSERSDTFQQLAAQVDSLLEDGSETVRREGGRIIVTPLEANTDPPSLTELRRRIDERLPRVDITELLIEVDNLTGFSRAFTHLDGAGRRDEGLLSQLYACILAQACNLGFKQMAASSGLPYRTLLWCNRWHLRDDTLDEAVTKLVNYHHGLPLSTVWGRRRHVVLGWTALPCEW